MIDRRQFSCLALSALAAPYVFAQNAPVEGVHYAAVKTRQPTRDRKQVEVAEFFAYGCSHCFAFEPALDAWQKALPRDVLFRRLPVAFQQGPAQLHQQLYFAIEALGQVEQLHRKVFEAIHVRHEHLQTLLEVESFLDKAGADRARIVAAMASFAVTSKAKQANDLAVGYGIEGTPTLGVDGRWITDGGMAGTNPRSLAVATYLLTLARKPG